MRILSDGGGDVGWTGDPAYDLRWLSLAEPRSLGAGKLEFVLKVASLSSVPPDSTWDVIFKTADGADHYVKMDSDTTGAVTFAYGDGEFPTDPLDTTGAVTFAYGDGEFPTDPLDAPKPADPASRYTADGTIRIVIARSAFGIDVGDELTAFNAEARIRGGVADPLPDAMPAQDVRDGEYTVKGPENCSVPQPDLAVTAGDITVTGLKGKGDNQVIVAVVHNLGTADASTVKVRFAVDGAQVGNVQMIGSIAAGGTGRASVGWDTRGQNGTHTIDVTADPDNAIAEPSESNNTGSRQVTVQGGKVR